MLEYNDYDRLIQLCDAISFPDGPTYVEKRLVDVVIRKGFNDLTIPKGMFDKYIDQPRLNAEYTAEAIRIAEGKN